MEKQGYLSYCLKGRNAPTSDLLLWLVTVSHYLRESCVKFTTQKNTTEIGRSMPMFQYTLGCAGSMQGGKMCRCTKMV